MNHIWNRGLLVTKKGKQCKSPTVILHKSQKLLRKRAPWNATFSEHSIAIHTIISVVGYVITFVYGVHRAQESSIFCDFLKNIIFRDFTAFFPFKTQANLFFDNVHFIFFFISFISTITTNKFTSFCFCLQNWYKTCWDQFKFL